MAITKYETHKSKNLKYVLFHTCRFCIFIILLQSSEVFCEFDSEIAPDNNHKIAWECNNVAHDSTIYSRNCRVYAEDANGKNIWIHNNSDLLEPTVKWLSNSLAKITIPCGSPCNYSIFYDIEEGVSDPFEFVIAVNVEKKVVARAGPTSILINYIFHNFEKSL